MPSLIALTPLASLATGAFWDDKLIQLDTLADLFKRNYFAPGALRMPDSPLVRKYLELSNDLALFDSIAPPQATDGRVDALAEALRSGAVPGGAMLKPGAGTGERAAVAMAVAERDGAGGAAGASSSKPRHARRPPRPLPPPPPSTPSLPLAPRPTLTPIPLPSPRRRARRSSSSSSSNSPTSSRARSPTATPPSAAPTPSRCVAAASQLSYASPHLLPHPISYLTPSSIPHPHPRPRGSGREGS